MDNRKNVNSARNELLIIIEYLLKETDEEHLSRVKDIQKYALKNYKVNIHKTRVSECLKYLKDLNDKYPKKFPFILYESIGLKNKKYFIEQRQFSMEDIYYICSAIKNDRYTGTTETNRLIDAVLDVTTNKHNNFIIHAALDNKFKNVAHYSDEVTKNVHKLDLAKVNKNIINFNTLSKENLCFAKTPVEKTTYVNPHRGYVYNVVDYDRGPVLIFINFETRALERYDVKKIKNLKVEESFRTKKENEKFDVSSLFKSEEYKSPQDELNDITMPEKGSEKCIAQFTFEARQIHLDSIGESFKQFFGKDLEYKIIEEDDKQIACCSIKTNTITFLKWAFNFNVITLIKIKGDKNLKDFYTQYLQLLTDNNEEHTYIE